MYLIRARRPFIGQPKYPARVDASNPLTRGLQGLVLPPYPIVQMRDTGFTAVQGSPSMSAGPAGAAIKTASSAVNAYELGTVGSLFVGGQTDCTIFMVRQCFDTTARNSAIFGYIATGRILSHAPYGDGNCYWDFGNLTAGSGRLSVAFTKTTNVEALVFVAGGGKGREIWRNGSRIANDTGATASLPADTGNFLLGAVGGTNSDDQNIYLFGIANRTWSDTEIKEWSRNPWQVFAQTDRRYFLPAASSPAVSARPQVFIAT
jgi:hypothetical protein